MLRFLVPGLLQTNTHLDLMGESRLPGLDMLFSRGRHAHLGCSSLEEQLCKELGIAQQQDLPIAAISLAASGKNPGQDYWLRADPVHMRVEREQIILDISASPSAEEAAMLCEAIAEHFGEEFSPHPLRPDAWIIKTATKPSLFTIPFSSAIGRDIAPHMPVGEDAMLWRKLLNEVQMLLFHHPVNMAREQRGEPTINSVWIWGGGHLPVLTGETQRRVFCNHPDWLALAKYAGSDVGSLPDRWGKKIPQQALIVMDEPVRLLQGNDIDGWLKAIKDFESNWLQPMLVSGLAFRIDDPLQDASLYWRRAYRWKFWRKTPKPAQSSFKVQPPPSDPGVDAFGNRY